MKIVLFPHGGSVNHGCEAIVRTTCGFLRKDNNEISLYSSDTLSDYDVRLNEIVNIIPNNDNFRVHSCAKFFMRIRTKFFKKNIDVLEIAKKYKFFKKMHFMLSIGGDNYCYPGMIHVLSELNIAIDYFKKPRILWGCSLDEKLINGKVLTELKGYKAIFVRESVSANILKNIGIQNNVYLYPDPAFTLGTQETKFIKFDSTECDIIGVNISPLIKRYSDDLCIKNNFIVLIKYIINNLNLKIALIPHVVQDGNSDFDYMAEIVKDIPSDKVEIVDKNYNCMQLKSLISKCKFFIGCRTHATIAAYSTCVPTLVVGYSNKSVGIARDIFGNEKDYVLPVSELNAENVLLNKFLELYDRRDDIKEYLGKFMPDYIKKASDAGDKLAEIIRKEQ